jgi:NNP family nitrate/nitrite transporter-like MFS transporter
LASLSAPLIAIALLPLMPWRGILLVFSIASAAAAVLFWKMNRGTNIRGVAPNWSALKIYFTDRNFWILGAFFGLNASAALGIYSILPAYLIDERGMSTVTANILVSLSRIGAIVVIFISGMLVDRFGTVKLIAASVALTSVPTILLGIGGTTVLTIAVLLQPMLAVVFFTPALAALAKIGPPESRNVAISLTTPMAVLFGGGFYPAILGILGEAGKFYIGFIILGILMILCLPILKLLRFGRDMG